jgi:3-oxoacyl-[acyl-carrier-protein] synthase II
MGVGYDFRMAFNDEISRRREMGRGRVVITGTGAVTSLGVGAPALVDRWIAGESGISGGYSVCGDFDPSQGMGRKEVRRTDRFTQLAAAAAEEALDEAGWNGATKYRPERVGCIVGTGVGGIATKEEQHARLRERGPGAVSPLTIPMIMPNAAAGYLAMRHGWLGPSFSVASACASGGHAIGLALRTIQSGDADAVLAAASEAALTPLGMSSFHAMDVLSPTGRSLPFDARRDGFVMGEGSGALVLEAAESAEARGATVLGELLGYATTADGYHITSPDPEARGAVRAMQLALEDAGLAPDDVDYVNAHGTGTERGDRVETLALTRALGEAAGRIPVSSTKSVIGHLLGAAGLVEAVATLHALRRRVAPPTAGYREREHGLELDYVPVARPLQTRHGARRAIALSNAFGFGGHNVVICLAAGTGQA